MKAVIKRPHIRGLWQRRSCRGGSQTRVSTAAATQANASDQSAAPRDGVAARGAAPLGAGAGAVAVDGAAAVAAAVAGAGEGDGISLTALAGAGAATVGEGLAALVVAGTGALAEAGDGDGDGVAVVARAGPRLDTAAMPVRGQTAWSWRQHRSRADSVPSPMSPP